MLFDRQILLLALFILTFGEPAIAGVIAFASWPNSTTSISVTSPTVPPTTLLYDDILLASSKASVYSSGSISTSTLCKQKASVLAPSRSSFSTDKPRPSASGIARPSRASSILTSQAAHEFGTGILQHHATSSSACAHVHIVSNIPTIVAIPGTVTSTSNNRAIVSSGYHARPFANSTASCLSAKSTPTSASSTGSIGGLIAAIGQVAHLSSTSPASVTGLNMSNFDIASESTATTNAVSILLSALPSNVASSVVSDIDSLTQQLAGTASASQSNGAPTQPATGPAAHPTAPPTTTSIPLSTTSLTPSTLMTVAAHSSSSSSSSSSSTSSATAAAVSDGGTQLKNASVAGIATGAAAGCVLVFLIGLILWRRRQQGKSLLGRRRSQQSSKRGSKRIFPEVAWLYDPRMTPKERPGSEEGSPHHSPNMSTAMLAPEQQREGAAGMSGRNLSAFSLVPEPRDGAIEMSSAPNSPPMHPARSTSPLLPLPGTALSTNEVDSRRRSSSTSPGPARGRRSGSSSPSGRNRSRSSFGASRPDLTRPMSAIYEEQMPPRPSTIDVRSGLLQPPYKPHLRHST